MSAQPDFIESPSGAAPNVVVILADALGFADISPYGSTEVQTPSLDLLARERWVWRFVQSQIESGAGRPIKR